MMQRYSRRWSLAGGFAVVPRPDRGRRVGAGLEHRRL